MGKRYSTPGPRAIHPSVATSSSVARCSLGAQLLWSRLIAAADDQGRQLGDPLLVKASCIPLIDASVRKVEAWLAEIEEAGMIRRYEADGTRLIQLTSWWDFQSGQRHAWPSRWPGPEGWASDVLRGHGMAAERDPAGTPQGPEGDPPAPERVPYAGAGAGAEPVPVPDRTRSGGYDDQIEGD